jgi:hypothetical protein
VAHVEDSLQEQEHSWAGSMEESGVTIQQSAWPLTQGKTVAGGDGGLGRMEGQSEGRAKLEEQGC